MVGSDMEHHVSGTIATIIMTIDAMIIGIIILTVILIYGINIPVG